MCGGRGLSNDFCFKFISSNCSRKQVCFSTLSLCVFCLIIVQGNCIVGFRKRDSGKTERFEDITFMLDLKTADSDYYRRFTLVFTERFVCGKFKHHGDSFKGKNKIFLCRQIKTSRVTPLDSSFRHVYARSGIGNTYIYIYIYKSTCRIIFTNIYIPIYV